MSIHLLSTLFIGLVLAMASIVVGLFARYLNGRSRIVASGILIVWLCYVGVMGYAGIIRSITPPGPLFLVVPVVLFTALFLTRHPGVQTFARRVPVEWLIGLQSFRVFVELALYGLHKLNLVPRMLTFEGANFDILIGLSAPLVAWLYATQKIDRRTVQWWNWLGIAMLANVIVRAFLTFPGPLNVLHTEVPNVGIGIFPFNYLPGFLAPLALYLHVLAMRSVSSVSGEQASLFGMIR